MKKLFNFITRPNMLTLFISVLLVFINLAIYGYTGNLAFIILTCIFALYPFILLPQMFYYGFGINVLINKIKNLFK